MSVIKRKIVSHDELIEICTTRLHAIGFTDFAFQLSPRQWSSHLPSHALALCVSHFEHYKLTWCLHLEPGRTSWAYYP